MRSVALVAMAALFAACGEETVRGVEINAEFSGKGEALAVALASRMDGATLRRLGGVPEVWPDGEPPLKLDVPFSLPVIVNFTERGPSGALPPDPAGAEEIRLASLEIARSDNGAEELTHQAVGIELWVGLVADPGPGEEASESILVARSGVLPPGGKGEMILAPGGDQILAKAMRARIFKMWLVLAVPVNTEKDPRRPAGKTSYTVRVATDFVG